MHVSNLMPLDKLERYIEEGYVSKRKHPEYPLFIYNYTAKTQFEWNFDEVTLQTRGLVLDSNYHVCARSLPKFFSYEQLEGKLPEGDFSVEEKLDGSMLMVFKYDGNMITATRGSFESEQAVDARKFIDENLFLSSVSEGSTHIFEYIAKKNRIVVDYDYEGLVLLAVCRNDTGEVSEVEVSSLAKTFNYRRPKTYSFSDLTTLLSYDQPNEEGFVLRYADNTRVKIKTDTYKKLHRLITGFNEKDVWEALLTNTIDKVLEDIPDEMYDWVKEVQKDLEGKFQDIKAQAMRDMKDLGNRKDNALYYMTCKYPSVMFYLLDQKPVDEMIWKMIKPKATQTFKIVTEEAN